MKVGAEPESRRALQAEYEKVYSHLEADFVPRCVGWDDDEEAPALVLEDLSDAFWPPPWSNWRIDAVLATLDKVHAVAAPQVPSIRRLEGVEEWLECWSQVAKAPGEFLALGLCSPDWLRQTSPKLLAAARAAPLDGGALLHLDIRSDNLCFVAERVVIIDWNFACKGNPDVDLACWLPSLQAEGGLAPESILPDAPELAALVAGYFALRAGRASSRPVVRDIQKEQLRTALPWSVRALQLPPLDAPRAP